MAAGNGKRAVGGAVGAYLRSPQLSFNARKTFGCTSPSAVGGGEVSTGGWCQLSGAIKSEEEEEETQTQK